MSTYHAADPALAAHTAHCDARPGSFGKSLFWEGPPIPAGVEIIAFAGPVVSLDVVPESMIRYVVRYDRERYLVPETDAQFANHSCDPNCVINDNYTIETRKPLQTGDEITISYNCASPEDIAEWGDFWDERWCFTCGCGAPDCVGELRGYRILGPPRD